MVADSPEYSWRWLLFQSIHTISHSLRLKRLSNLKMTQLGAWNSIPYAEIIHSTAPSPLSEMMSTYAWESMGDNHAVYTNKFRFISNNSATIEFACLRVHYVAEDSLRFQAVTATISYWEFNACYLAIDSAIESKWRPMRLRTAFRAF